MFIKTNIILYSVYKWEKWQRKMYSARQLIYFKSNGNAESEYKAIIRLKENPEVVAARKYWCKTGLRLSFPWREEAVNNGTDDRKNKAKTLLKFKGK